MDNIKEAAEYLMYKGPSLNDLILEAKKNNQEYNVKNTEDDSILEVKTKTSYDLKIIDRYWFNSDRELYKRTLTMRGKEKVIFDKFKEVRILLETINSNDFLVS